MAHQRSSTGLHGPPSGPVLIPSTDMTTSGPPLDNGERSSGKNDVKNIREKNRMRKLRELYKFLEKVRTLLND